MEVLLDRKYRLNTYSIGKFFVNNIRLCESMEDKDRGLTQTMPLSVIKSKKVWGKTAIPLGRYKIDLNTISPKFKNRSWAKKYGGRVPRLLDVPGWSGVLIHPMTDASQSEGCIGVGDNLVKGKILNSQKRFFELMDKYFEPARIRGEEVWITIK